MLSDDERLYQRPGPTRDVMARNQFGSLGPRRQSARPSAPPPISASGFAQPIQPLAHPFGPRQPNDPRSADAYQISSSDSSNSQFAQYLPRQVHNGDPSASQSRSSVHGRRPMNPPALNLPSEPVPPTASNPPGNLTVVGSGRPSPSLSPASANPISPPRAPSSRPSSRRALVAALSLAQEAVQLDTAGNSPQMAVDAYARSVVLLREVMSRVSSGESAGAGGSTSRAGSSSRSLTPREEEVRRLRSIHDTYAERLVVLCNMYNIASPDVPPTVQARPSAPPSRQPSQEVLSAAMHAGSRSLSRATSSRTGDEDPSINSLLGLASPERETPSTINPFTSESSTPNILPPNRVSNLPPQRPPPIGPPPPKPLTPLTARPGQQQQQQQQPALLEQPERHITHRRVPSNGSDRISTTDDSDQTEVVSRPPSAMRKVSGNDERPLPGLVNSSLPPLPSASPTSPTPVPSPSTPRGGSEQQQAKRGVSTSSQISSSTAYDSASSAAGLRSRGNTASSASSWSDAGVDGVEKIPVRPVGSTGQGSIAMRRKVNSGSSNTGLPPLATGQQQNSVPGPSHSAGAITSASNRLTADSLPPSTLSSLGIATGRSRAVSQPGRRPSNAVDSEPRPPLPMTANGSLIIPRKASIPHSIGLGGGPSNSRAPSGINITVHTANGSSRIQTPGFGTASLNGSYFQTQSSGAQSLGAPPSPPVDPLRRPFHLMGLVYASLASKQGGFITRRLYVPRDVWTQGGAKLSNLTEKGKCVEILNAGMEDVVVGSGEFFRGAGRGNAERWLKCLDDWSGVCDGVLAGPGKKLGVGEGFSSRKSTGVTSWGGKFSKAIDRMTTAKGSDQPAIYIAGLSKLLQQAQLFDEHVKAFSNSFNPTPYSTLSPEIRHQIELRLKRCAEFFASVVLTWVIRDLSLLLDKYVKKGEKWLTE